MGFIPFYKVEPELAERETRTITLVVWQDELPEATYGLIESYCPDPACDCRRVMLNIACEERLDLGYLATISYGFDRDDEMAGPFLDPLNPQSDYSEALLELLTVSALNDEAYVQRLEEHYRLVKQAAADFGHPAYVKIQHELHHESSVGFTPYARSERVPRSAPCPCGSGKKYKQCCMWRDSDKAHRQNLVAFSLPAHLPNPITFPPRLSHPILHPLSCLPFLLRPPLSRLPRPFVPFVVQNPTRH